MGRCERCGADALNMSGVCRNCGWQAPMDLYDDHPSIGETRPADVVAPAQGAAYPRGTSTAPVTPPGSLAPRSGPASGAVSRFCGVCGARITGSEAFCGQCGSPVTAGPGQTGSQPGPTRYQGGAQSWGMDDADAYTEAMPEPLAMAGGRNPYVNDPYGRQYAQPYGSGGATRAAAQGGLSRTARITIGSLFLGASVLVAIITITLAVVWFAA